MYSVASAKLFFFCPCYFEIKKERSLKSVEHTLYLQVVGTYMHMWFKCIFATCARFSCDEIDNNPPVMVIEPRNSNTFRAATDRNFLEHCNAAYLTFNILPRTRVAHHHNNEHQSSLHQHLAPSIERQYKNSPAPRVASVARSHNT